MTITTEAGWKADGSPHHNATPIQELFAEFERRHGKGSDLCWTLGNAAHLAANPPEDHTPYSHTGWPGASPYPYVLALDFAGLHFATAGAYWVALKRKSLAPWVKYINLNNTHYAWEPTEKLTHSSDDPGHVHLSIRSDWAHSSIATGWPNLVSGSTGVNVQRLQDLLNLQSNAGLSVDGVFGAHTLSAVKAFQSKAFLPVDGQAGTHTRIALAVKLT